MKNNKELFGKFEESTLRLEASGRGGGVEISLDSFGFKGEKMSAYQNYLGGGMLGSVQSNDTIHAYGKPCTEKRKEKLDKIANALREYFHHLTNHDDEWEGSSYEENQNRPKSAY